MAHKGFISSSHSHQTVKVGFLTKKNPIDFLFFSVKCCVNIQTDLCWLQEQDWADGEQRSLRWNLPSVSALVLNDEKQKASEALILCVCCICSLRHTHHCWLVHLNSEGKLPSSVSHLFKVHQKTTRTQMNSTDYHCPLTQSVDFWSDAVPFK